MSQRSFGIWRKTTCDLIAEKIADKISIISYIDNLLQDIYYAAVSLSLIDGRLYRHVQSKITL